MGLFVCLCFCGIVFVLLFLYCYFVHYFCGFATVALFLFLFNGVGFWSLIFENFGTFIFVDCPVWHCVYVAALVGSLCWFCFCDIVVLVLHLWHRCVSFAFVASLC